MALKLGEYILEKPIGRGAMGQVWLAKQESLDRMVAVKVLPKELARDPSFRARFEREAKIAASLIHPNVIQIYSFGIEKDVPYFAMEFVEGEDLSVKIKQGKGFTVREAVRIVADVARALECACEKGMIHRDIKPGNIMIARNGTVKVMDFGLAKAASVRSAITQPGLIMGTPAYMSPEQGKGKELDVRADMYSLGIVLYKLLTGTVPFEADTPTAVIFLHIYEPAKPVRELNPDIPEEIERITTKLLEKKPGARYPNPTALLADLEAFLGGSTTTTAAVAGAGPAMRTEVIGQPGQPAARTETMDAGAAQPTSVTEPILTRRETSASAPTIAVPPPTGYVRTQDEELEFLEDLLQGDVPGASARAAEFFEQKPGLREGYAKQLFVHGLLRSQIDMQDRGGRNKRITRVLSVAGGGGQAAFAISAIKAGPRAARRKRSPLFYYCVIGVIFFVLAGVMFMLFIPGMLPEAELFMATMAEKSLDSTDRVYDAEVVVYAPTRRELRGTLHVRGARKWVALFDGGTYIIGSEGEEAWASPPGEYVYEYKDGRPPAELSGAAGELPLMSMESLLARRGDFHMKMVGDTELPAYEGRKLVEMHCEVLPGKTGSEIKHAKYWIDKESGVVMRALLELRSGPMAVGHRTVTINYVRDERHESYFYSLRRHKGGKTLFQGKKRRESEDPWEEPGTGDSGIR